MFNFQSNWAQLKYLIKHKWYVGRELFKYRLFMQMITHDLSKFSPIEWESYRLKFFDKKNDYLTNEAFKFGWHHHYTNNPHHWEFWLYYDNGKITPLQMPDKYVIEMYCDWVGAGLAINGKRDVKDWYNQNKDRILLHPITRIRIEGLLNAN
jgi:hypothetical protein